MIKKIYSNNSFKVFCVILILFIFFIAIFSSCSYEKIRTEQTRDKIGTYVTVTIYTYSTLKNPNDIIDKAFLKIDELSKILSNYDPESSISILNKYGYLDNAPDELIEIIKLSKEYNKITNGAFDISIDPLLKLWSEGLWKETEDIQQQKIKEKLQLVGTDYISIDNKNIKLNKNGMSLTLGGVAKGYIVDKMIEYIRSVGITNALVNAGGDIMTLGTKPNNEKWVVSLENPDNPEQKIITFGLDNMAIATSGNYYRYFDPSKEVHHIIDPRTGYSANKCISATIIAGSATLADILATSVFVLGPVEGIDLVESLEGVEALIIDNNRNINKSSGLEKYIFNY